MKIIKHGKPIKEPEYLFICRRCECEFIMTQTDLRDLKLDVNLPFSYCPECGYKLKGEKINE